MPKKLITVSCEHPRKQARSGSEDGEAEFKSDDEGGDGIGGYDDDGEFDRRRRRSKSKKRKNKERGKKEAGGAVLRATPVSRTDSPGKETPRTVGRNIGLIRELCGLATDVSSDKRRRSKTEAGALLSDDKVKKKSVNTAASIKQERSGNYPDKGGEQRPKKHRSVAHDPGTRVYACWIDGSEHSGEWYPGTVVGHRIAKTGPDKGKRVYHIEFDDGDQSRSLEECFVMKFDQYLALIRACKGGDESSSSSTKTASKTVPPRLHVCTPNGSATTNDGLPKTKTWECHVCKAHNTTPKRCPSCKAWRGGGRQVGAKVTKGRKALRKETTIKAVDEVLPSKRRKKDNAKEPSATKGRKDEEAKHTKLPRKIVTPSKRISVTKAVSAPSHKPGDAIYACTLEKNECSGFWYPGTVKNVVTIDQGPDVGFLQYDVEFDDGRAGACLKEDYITVQPHSHSNQVEPENRDSRAHSSAYSPGSRVIACWRTEWGDSSGTWFPGTIEGSRVGHHGPRKGKRFYHIKFDDGRVDKSLEEAFIMKRIDQSDDLQVGSKVLACWHTEDGWCTGRWYPSTIEGFASIHHGRGNTNLLCNVVYEDGSMSEGLDCKYVMMLVQNTNERGVPMTKFCVRGKGDVQVMEHDNKMLLLAEDGRGDNEKKVRHRDAGTTEKVRAKAKKLATMSSDFKEGEAFPDETSMSTRACIKNTSEKTVTVRPDEEMPAENKEGSVEYGGAMQNAEGEAFPVEKSMSTRACIKDISKKTARPNDDMPAKVQEDSQQYRGAMQNTEGGGDGGVLSNQSKEGVSTGVTSPSADETMTKVDAEEDVEALLITERNLSSKRSNHEDRSGGEGVSSADGDNLKTMPKKRDNFQEEDECVIVKRNVQVSSPIKVEKKERKVASVGSNQMDDAAETEKVVAKKDIEEVIELALDEMDFNTPSTFQEKQSGDENVLSGSDSKAGVGIQEEGKQDLCKKNAAASSLIEVGKIGGKCARSALGRDNEKDGMSPRAYQTFPLRPSSDSPPVLDGINKFPPYPQFPWNAASSRGQPYPTFRTAPFETYQYQHPSCVAFDNMYSVTFSEPGLLGFTFEETEDGGTIITKVEPHSQADRAGIKAGDVVCSPAGDGRGRYPCSSFQSVCIERPIDFNIRRQSAASTDTGALQRPYYPAPFNPYNSAPYQYLYPPHYAPQWTHAPYLEPTLSPPVQEAPNADKTSGKKKKRTRLKTPQDFEVRKLRKNAQARARAAKLTDKFEEVKRKCSEERTTEEEQLLAKVEECRSRKNLRSKLRAVEKKQEIERILAKRETKRTKREKIILDTAMKVKQRKNEIDRIRRRRLKMLGIKGNTKPKGVTISGRPEKEPINFPNCGVPGLCDEPVTLPQPSPAGPTNHSGKHSPLSPPSPANNLLFPCESAEMPEVISKAVTMSPVQATVRCTEDARNGRGQDGPLSDICDDGNKNEVGQTDNCTDQVPEYSSIEAV